MEEISFPESMRTVGGIIGDIAAYTMQQSHRPNFPLAFAGALAFVAFAGSRRFRTRGNARPNLYIIAHGWSGVGKDQARKTNAKLAHACGLTSCIIDDFRSGEGLQDTVLTTPVCLSQFDEVDGLFNAAGMVRDTMSEGMRRELLKLWEASGSFMPRRKLAASRFGKKDDKTPDCVYHPHLTLFGTGITGDVYKAITKKMASDGFFARLMFINAGKRGEGQSPTYADPPGELVARCRLLCGYREIVENGHQRLWPEFTPEWKDTGHLVPTNAEAENLMLEVRQQADAMYNVEEDGPSNAIWNRAAEKCERLALVFALSDNPEAPAITGRHWRLARDLVWYCTYEQLKLLGLYGADTEYEELQKRILRLLHRGRTPKRILLKNTHIKAADLDEVLDTMCEQGDIIAVNDKGEETPIKTCKGVKGVYFALP